MTVIKLKTIILIKMTAIKLEYKTDLGDSNSVAVIRLEYNFDLGNSN